MELTMREKEMLIMFGDTNRANTHTRLTIGCVNMTDPISKAVACSLRNKIYELPCDKWYTWLYCRTKEELSNLNGKGEAA